MERGNSAQSASDHNQRGLLGMGVRQNSKRPHLLEHFLLSPEKEGFLLRDDELALHQRILPAVLRAQQRHLPGHALLLRVRGHLYTGKGEQEFIGVYVYMCTWGLWQLSKQVSLSLAHLTRSLTQSVSQSSAY